MSGRKEGITMRKRGMAFLLSAAMVMSGVPTQAIARDVDLTDDPAPGTTIDLSADQELSGTWGSCEWTINESGVLTINPGTGANTGGYSPWEDYAEHITKVQFAVDPYDGSKVVFPADSSALFGEMDNLTSIDFSNPMDYGTPIVDTSAVENMANMFYGCDSLESAYLSYLDLSNVTDMSGMFVKCQSLSYVDIQNLNTNSLKNMSGMFSECSNLVEVDEYGFYTSSVTDMSGLFSDCFKLPKVGLAWDTSSVTNMSGMFKNCTGLDSLDVSRLDTSSVTNMSNMFDTCKHLSSLDLSGWDTSSVTNMNAMFRNCRDLKSITVGTGWNTENAGNGKDMFFNCVSLVGGNNTVYDENYTDIEYARVDTSEDPGYLTLLEAAPIDVGFWGSCYWTLDSDGLLTVYGGEGDNTGNQSPWYRNSSDIRAVEFVTNDDGLEVVLPEDSSALFGGLSNLQEAKLQEADTSNVNYMQFMFSNCDRLATVDLNSWDVSLVSDMSDMFHGCFQLSSMGIEGWKTSSLQKTDNMFRDCNNLRTLDLNGWDTRELTSASYMFYNSGIQDLAVSAWETPKLENLYAMFYQCFALRSLDLSGWDTSKVSNMSYMFAGNSGLSTITVGKGWSTESVIDGSNMFANCALLRGGNGTYFDWEHVDDKYAHVDNGPDYPGYLTMRPEPIAEPAFTAASMAIGEQIGLNFWLEFPDVEGFDYEDSYVTLSVDDKDARELTTNFSDCTMMDSKGRYGFCIDLTSVEMAEPVTATFHYRDGDEEKTAELSYTVEKYLNALTYLPGQSIYLYNLAGATANFGHYMQPYLARENDWIVGEDYEEILTDYGQYSDSAKDELSHYQLSGVIGGSGIKSVGGRISFESLTTVNLYLTTEDPDAEVTASATYGGKTFQAEKQADGRWLLRVEGLKPLDYATNITVNGTAAGDFVVNASVLSLLNAMWNSDEDQVRDDALASAFFLWQSANYFND